MPTPISHPRGQALLGELSDAFKSKIIFQRKDRHIIFLCGGPVKPYSRSMRIRFLKYSQKELHNFRVFLAEDADKDLTKYGTFTFLNIADFEKLLADISDCIIVFPESPGSIAELAYFTNSTNIIKKLLVVNDVDIQNDSFINKGIIEKINNKSGFRSTIMMNFRNPTFNQIRQRLEDRLSKAPKKFEYNKWNKLKLVHKLFIIFQIVYLFRALQYESILHCLTNIFGTIQEKQLRQILSILIASKYIERKGDEYDFFVPISNVDPFLDFRNFDLNPFKTKVIDFYERFHDDTFKIIKGC